MIELPQGVLSTIFLALILAAQWKRNAKQIVASRPVVPGNERW